MGLYRTPELAKLIDEQVQRWALFRAQQRVEPARARPLISVSRQHASGGSELARRLGERLGYTCWDQEILHEIAIHDRAPEAMVARLDEHGRNVLEEYVAVFGAGPHLTSDEYMETLIQVLHTIADHGGAVVVGRGSQYLLDAERCLRVRAIAPLVVRARRVAERERYSQRHALAAVRDADADERRFIRDRFGRDSDDPASYDLILNTGTLSIDQAADVVIAAHRARFGSVAVP